MSELDEQIEEAMKDQETEEVTVTEESATPEPQQEEASTEETLEELLAPEYWGDGAKTAFTSLAGMEGAHPHVKAILDQYNQEFSQYGEIQQQLPTLQQYASEYGQLVNHLGQYQEFFTRNNTNMLSVLANSIDWMKQLQGDPSAALKNLMRQYNVTAQDLSGENDPYLTDQDRLYMQKIEGLQGQLAAMQQQQQQSTTYQQQNAILQQIKTLEGMRDDNGNAIHPWLNQTDPSYQDGVTKLFQIMNSGLVSTWEEAAAMAEGLIPGIKAQRDAATAKRQQAERQQAAQKAREASRTVSGKSSKGGAEKGKGMSIDDAVTEAIQLQENAA